MTKPETIEDKTECENVVALGVCFYTGYLCREKEKRLCDNYRYAQERKARQSRIRMNYGHQPMINVRDEDARQ